MVLEKELSVNRPQINSMIEDPVNIVDFARDYLHLHEEPEECLYMICLNAKNRILGIFEISRGSATAAIVGVREVFQKALLINALRIVFVHNHPSGDWQPSRMDIALTERMVQAGRIIGIEVLDHVIIGDGYCSMAERGYILREDEE